MRDFRLGDGNLALNRDERLTLEVINCETIFSISSPEPTPAAVIAIEYLLTRSGSA